jgi:hypothetical protein
MALTCCGFQRSLAPLSKLEILPREARELRLAL